MHQLIVDVEGRMVLAIRGPVDQRDLERIREEFARWREAQPPELLIISEAEVVKIVSLELELPEPASFGYLEIKEGS